MKVLQTKNNILKDNEKIIANTYLNIESSKNKMEKR
jgi:hypothetical protein